MTTWNQVILAAAFLLAMFFVGGVVWFLVSIIVDVFRNWQRSMATKRNISTFNPFPALSIMDFAFLAICAIVLMLLLSGCVPPRGSGNW